MVPNLPQLLQTFFRVCEVPVAEIARSVFPVSKRVFSEDPAQECDRNEEDKKYNTENYFVHHKP